MLKYCFTSLITRFHFPHLLWPRSPRWQFIYGCCCCSVTQSCPTLQPHGLQHTRPLSLTISWSLPKFMYIASVMPSSHLILWCSLLLLPSIFPSIREFSSESTVPIRWPKYFSFSISPSNEFSGFIYLRIDGYDLFAVQGTLESLLQYHSSKASILRPSAFFTVQLSHPYMTTRKIIALTRQTTVGKVLSLLCNMLYKLVITYFQGASVF